MSFKICNSIRLDAESQSDNSSITKVMERLDIKTMLQRASMGILDLKSYSRPSAGDVAGASARKGEEIDALLEQPTTVIDNLFGADRETVEQQRRMFEETANRSRVKKKQNITVKTIEPPKTDEKANEDDQA